MSHLPAAIDAAEAKHQVRLTEYNDALTELVDAVYDNPGFAVFHLVSGLDRFDRGEFADKIRAAKAAKRRLDKTSRTLIYLQQELGREIVRTADGEGAPA